jgi:hypothetical protein
VNRAIRSDRPHHSVLQHSQQLRLKTERHFADLVQEHRAAVGRGKQSIARPGSSGEGATLMAEHLGFEQVVWDGGAVNRHERALAPRRHIVSRVGDYFLAGTAFARNQDSNVGRRDSFDERTKLCDCRMLSNQDFVNRQALYGPQCFAFECHPFRHALHRRRVLRALSILSAV